MRPNSEKGLTLVELLLAIAILGIIVGATMPLLSTTLRVHNISTAKSSLHHEGLLAMEQMTNAARNTTYLFIPNNHSPSRTILAVSDMVNDDNDFYFNDPLFPRVDEDTGLDIAGDTAPGILTFDDDDDGLIDEVVGSSGDDDEDNLANEDVLDGIDNDSDGNIDEDSEQDSYLDGKPGIAGMDDDGDGAVDEGGASLIFDCDEDGAKYEDRAKPVIYSFVGGVNKLQQINFTGTVTTSVDLSTHVTNFTTTYYPPDATNAPRISISLTLTGNNGEIITFFEYVYPRNILQKTGKRVR